MLFSLTNTKLDFEIPDDWWDDSGMVGFQPTSKTYTVAQSEKWLFRIVALNDVKPPTRSTGVPWFNQERMVRILAGFVSADAIPPIEVHEPPNTPLYEVRNGFHRYYASVAAGFEYLPISVVPYDNIKDFLPVS